MVDKKDYTRNSQEGECNACIINEIEEIGMPVDVIKVIGLFALNKKFIAWILKMKLIIDTFRRW